MTSHDPTRSNLVQEMRDAFDRSFEVAATEKDESVVHFLAIGVEGHRFAVRLQAIDGLVSDKPITSVPSAMPELLGVAGFRGAIVPVFDLHRLLGHGRADSPRWLLLLTHRGESGVAHALALAFARLEGHISTSPTGIASEPPRDGGIPGKEIFHDGEVLRTIVPVTEIVATLARRVAALASARRK